MRHLVALGMILATAPALAVDQNSSPPHCQFSTCSTPTAKLGGPPLSFLDDPVLQILGVMFVAVFGYLTLTGNMSPKAGMSMVMRILLVQAAMTPVYYN